MPFQIFSRDNPRICVELPPPRSGSRRHGTHVQHFERSPIDAARFPGDIHLVLPTALYPRRQDQIENLRPGSTAIVKRWLDRYGRDAKRLFYEAKYAEEQYTLLVRSMRLIARAKPLVLRKGGVARLHNLPLSPKDEIPIFLRIDPPQGARPGSFWEFDVSQFDTKTKELLGGSRYRVVVARQRG